MSHLKIYKWSISTWKLLNIISHYRNSNLNHKIKNFRLYIILKSKSHKPRRLHCKQASLIYCDLSRPLTDFSVSTLGSLASTFWVNQKKMWGPWQTKIRRKWDWHLSFHLLTWFVEECPVWEWNQLNETLYLYSCCYQKRLHLHPNIWEQVILPEWG